MMTEGVGRRAPLPVVMEITPAEARAVFTQIEFKDRYDASTEGWARSVIDPTNPRRAVEVGVLGEHALASWLRKRTGLAVYPDLAFHEQGDPGSDLTLAGLGIQIKTRVKHKRTTLVKVDQAKGWQVLVAAKLYEEPGGYEVLLLGWIPQQDVIGCPKEQGLGNWWNYVVPDHSLLPMSDLPAEFLHEGEPDPLPRK